MPEITHQQLDHIIEIIEDLQSTRNTKPKDDKLHEELLEIKRQS